MPKIINYGLCAIIVALFVLICVYKHTIHVLTDEKIHLADENSKLQLAIANAQDAYKRQEHQIRLREQEAAEGARQSQKHMDEIMNQKVPEDCHRAIYYGIQSSRF